MRKLITIFLFLITFNNLSAQTDEQVINEILYDLFRSEHFSDTIFLKKGRIKTYLECDDSTSFYYMTGLEVPSKIIAEWKTNEEKEDFYAELNEIYLNKKDTSFYENDTIIAIKPIFKCLAENEIYQIYARNHRREPDNNRKRLYVYSVSKILFDNSKENAIFHFTGSAYYGALYTETILIKKVFGKWLIITKYHFAMT